MVYLALPTETDTSHLVLHAWQDRKRILAPKVSWNQRRMIPLEIGSLTEDLMVEEIATNVWRHVSYHELEGIGRFPANGLVVVSEDAAALVDTPWTNAQTQQLIDWVSKSLNARVETVIATHSHADCMGGLAAAHKFGAVSYATQLSAELAKENGQPAPQTTFVDATSVKVGSLDLELRFAGPGHTVDNIVVWAPEKLTLFGGCMVKSLSATGLGYTAEADVPQWPHTVEALLQRYGSARLVVPGHGAPGGTELLTHTLKLLKNQ